MIKILSAVSLASVIAFEAGASELEPLQAGTFELGTHTVSIYYIAAEDAYEVVATIVPGGDAAGAPIRFVGFLRPGQKALVSAGEFGTTAEPATLELVHRGNLLLATEVAKGVAVAE
jgi:hypothetical protein